MRKTRLSREKCASIAKNRSNSQFHVFLGKTIHSTQLNVFHSKISLIQCENTFFIRKIRFSSENLTHTVWKYVFHTENPFFIRKSHSYSVKIRFSYGKYVFHPKISLIQCENTLLIRKIIHSTCKFIFTTIITHILQFPFVLQKKIHCSCEKQVFLAKNALLTRKMGF